MPLLPFSLYKEYLMVPATSVKQDAVIRMLAKAAEDTAARFCGFRFAADSNSVPLVEVVDACNGFIRPRARPILEVLNIQDTWSGANDPTYLDLNSVQWTQLYIQGTFSDGAQRYQVNYLAGYTVLSLPAGVKGAILEICRRAYRSRDDAKGQRTMDGVSGLDGDIRDILTEYVMTCGMT